MENRKFTRSRLEDTQEKDWSKKTLILGFVTILFFLFVLMFGLPLLIKWSLFLGNNKKDDSSQQTQLPPLAPRLFVPYESTNSATISIKGSSELKTKVSLFKNGDFIEEKEVDNEGNFLFENVSLSGDENRFYAISSFENGSKSQNSTEMTINYDNISPILEMKNPTEDELKVDYSDFDIEGKTERDASVNISGKLAIVDSGGNFKLKVQLSPGKNEYDIKATDLAGNETSKKIVINYDF